MKDYFISYATQDMSWADWIAWEVEALGYETMMQRWDFLPGTNFVQSMQEAVLSCRQLLLVMSQNSIGSHYVAAEWSAFFSRDPDGSKRLLLPVRIDSVIPPGLLSQIVYVDLFETTELTARERLSAALGVQRQKPQTAPGFPGGRNAVFARNPKFPLDSQRQRPDLVQEDDWADILERPRLPSIRGRQFGRRFATTALDALVRKKTRAGAPLSAVLVDVDGMSGINTKHGANIGDVVLERLTMFCEELSGRVLVARTGDDTLLVLLHAVAADATAIAESVLQRVANHDWNAVADRLFVHISAGVAEFSKEREPFLVLLDAYFAQLHARRIGGNRVSSIAEVDRASLKDLYSSHFQSRTLPGS